MCSTPSKANPPPEESSASRIWLAGKEHNETKPVNKKDVVNDSQMAKARARKETQRGNPSYAVQRQVFILTKKEFRKLK